MMQMHSRHVNEDGRISIKDATIVQKYIVGGYETGNVGLPITVE